TSPGLQSDQGFLARRIDDRREVARSLVDGDLPVGASALFADRADVLTVLTGAEIVDDVVDESEPLLGEVGHRHLPLLAPVDELAGNAVAGRAPLVLGDERRWVLAEPEILLTKLQELRDRRLHERDDAHRLVDARRGVADPELDRRVQVVRPEIPPDLLAVVDGVGLDEELDVVLPLVVAREFDGDPRA